MTEVQFRRRVAFWMRRLSALGIAHYEFDVEVAEHPNGNTDAWACIEMADTYDRFSITIADEALSADVEEVDRHIVHELCHVPIHRLMTAAHRVDGQIPAAAWALWDAELHDAMERVVEQFTRALCDAYAE
jgi:hypothetical protein